MPSPEFLAQGIILGSEPSGEKFVIHSLLTTDQGIISLLARRSNKPGRQVGIDLFDEGEFRFERRPDSRYAFLKETQILRKHAHIAHRYKAFQAAARFARLIRANPIPIENQEQIYTLLKRGLEAWETHKDPDAALLKCLYLYCRNEGYPIREEWAMRLPSTEYSRLAKILNQPLESSQYDNNDLIASLETYLERHTHIRLGS